MADMRRKQRRAGQQKKRAARTRFSNLTGGELGIRTPDALLGHTRLAGEHLRPLGQLSVTAVL